jgi:hypothetical protein
LALAAAITGWGRRRVAVRVVTHSDPIAGDSALHGDLVAITLVADIEFGRVDEKLVSFWLIGILFTAGEYGARW